MTNTNFISLPANGAVERDWTKETLTVDLVNGIGEKFHFEIKPNESPIAVAKGGDTSHGGKCQLDITLPILAGK